MSVVHIAAVDHSIGSCHRFHGQNTRQVYISMSSIECTLELCQYLSDIVAVQYSSLSIQIPSLLERKYQDPRAPSM